MDEPFGALDPLTRAEMQDMLRDLLSRLKKTVLLVTHDLDEALYLAIASCCSKGKVVADLAPEEFLRSKSPEVQRLTCARCIGARSPNGRAAMAPASSRNTASEDCHAHPRASVAHRGGHAVGDRHRRACRDLAHAPAATGRSR